jgi:LysM repeat protein
MTSDAKIGLLLGLVFIFVIAFIINGLPHFRDRGANNELGLAGKERKAQETLDSTQLQGKLPFEVNELGLTAQNTTDGVRFQMPLPGSELSVIEPGQSHLGPVEANNMGESVTGAPVIGSVAQEPIPVASQSTRQVAPTSAQKTYVVREGDILAEIAKKVYGPAEGKKPANIDRIFQANRNQLKSPAKLQIGQKLVIPPLPAAKADKSKPAEVLSGPAFEKVESVGRMNVAGPAQDTGQGNWYVVHDGDSLWKIASSQLGNGSRYSEIVKLNSGVLHNEDDLVVGMRLRMPAR